MYCSKCERQGHNLFYLDNTAQVGGVLRGTLSEEGRPDLVGVLVLNYSKTGGRFFFFFFCLTHILSVNVQELACSASVTIPILYSSAQQVTL